DAHDVELFLEAFGDADHGVRHEASRKPMELRELRILNRAFGNEVPIRQLEVDARRERLPHLPFRSLNFDRTVKHLDGDPFGNRVWFFANSKNCSTLSVNSPPNPSATKCYTAPRRRRRPPPPPDRSPRHGGW